MGEGESCRVIRLYDMEFVFYNTRRGWVTKALSCFPPCPHNLHIPAITLLLFCLLVSTECSPSHASFPVSPEFTYPTSTLFIYLSSEYLLTEIQFLQSGVFASLQTYNVEEGKFEWFWTTSWSMAIVRPHISSLGWKRSTRWSRIFLSREWHLLPWTFLESFGEKRWAYK